MFWCHLTVNKPQKVFVKAYERHSFRMRAVNKIYVAAFSHQLLKSNIFLKINTRRREKYFGTFNMRKRMLIRFVDFEISNLKGLYVRISEITNLKGLYVRISVIGATCTVPVNEWSIYFCTQLYQLAVRSYQNC